MDRVTGRPFATRSEVLARHGMVATSQPLATQVGLDLLKAGGSAVDAALAANAALGLMEPTGCGIGGDLFAIVYEARTGRLHGLNASGRSPQALTLSHLQSEVRRLGLRSIPPHGFLPVSVPGAVHGWGELHARFGRRPWADVLAPARAYAEEGFPVSEVIADAWARGVAAQPPLPGAFRETYAPGGRAPAPGDVFRNPDLARTYALLAAEGPDAFYRGALAREIDTFFSRHGGWLRRSDLEAHRSNWVEPLSTNYRGYDVHELPPNGQGLAVLQMLNILEGFDLAGAGFNSADALHLMVEAKKLAFEDRARFYADPEFAEVPVAGLLAKSYAATRRREISRERAALAVTAGRPQLDQGDTVYLTAADAEGNLVSLIQSNYRGMGCGLVVPGLGFAFQNRGEQFVVFEPGHANLYAPGKRPFHTLIPGFITREGRPWVSFGLMGGAMQPQGHVQIITNLIDFGLNLQEAGDAPRWQHVGSTDYDTPPMRDGGRLLLESGVTDDVRAELQRRGHVLGDDKGGFGGYQAIRVDQVRGVYAGASESRKDGQASGW